MMPKGVDHVKWLVTGRIKTEVQKSLMPKGVDHPNNPPERCSKARCKNL